MDEKFREAGCVKTNLEPAMYMKFEGNGNDKKIVGLAVTHVDDILHMGEDSFDNGSKFHSG